jgi:hypothetical protein
LIEALADLEPQTPQRNVVGNMRIAGGAEQNGIFSAQAIESVLRHHDAMLAEIISAPIEILELEGKGTTAKRFHDLPARWHDFLTNSISRYCGDAIGLHVFPV